MKLILFAFFMALTSLKASAQDGISLKLNNKLIGKISSSTATPVILEAQRSRYKNIRSILMEFWQTQSSGPYKRTIEITDKDERQIYSIEESSQNPGTYVISSPATIRILQKQKTIKVFVILNPINNKMGLPSRRNLFVEVHMH